MRRQAKLQSLEVVEETMITCSSFSPNPSCVLIPSHYTMYGI